MIRPIFYNHFQDKYEVIERIIREEIFIIFTLLTKQRILYTISLISNKQHVNKGDDRNK